MLISLAYFFWYKNNTNNQNEDQTMSHYVFPNELKKEALNLIFCCKHEDLPIYQTEDLLDSWRIELEGCGIMLEKYMAKERDTNPSVFSALVRHVKVRLDCVHFMKHTNKWYPPSSFFVVTDTIWTMIRKIRKELEDNPNKPV
jgi:hypothetical protein